MKTLNAKTQLVREFPPPTNRTFQLMNDSEFVTFCKRRKMRISHAA